MNRDFDYVNQFDSNSPPPQTRYVTYVPYGLTPETYEERKSIKKIANIIGGSLLIMMAISEIIVIALRVVLSFAGYWGIEQYNFLAEPAFLQFLQSMLSITMFTLPFIFLFKICGFRISSLVKLKKPKKKDLLPYFLLGAGGCFFANFAVNFASQIFKNFGIDYQVDYGEKPEGFLGFMLTFIAIAVVPPLVEEFACRGLILGSLRKFGDGFAILCSSILFGVMHGNFQQMPFAFLVGLALGYITVKTNTIWIAVAVHAFNNAVSVVIDYSRVFLGDSAANIISVIILTAGLLFVVLGVFLLRDNDKAYELKKPKIKSTQKQVNKWFYTAPTIIIFAVLNVIESIQYFI